MLNESVRYLIDTGHKYDECTQMRNYLFTLRDYIELFDLDRSNP